AGGGRGPTARGPDHEEREFEGRVRSGGVRQRSQLAFRGAGGRCARRWLHSVRGDIEKGSGELLHKTVSRALAAIAVLAAALTPAVGDDDFPIVGVYTKDEVCRGDGSDRCDLVVTITRNNIH